MPYNLMTLARSGRVAVACSLAALCVPAQVVLAQSSEERATVLKRILDDWEAKQARTRSVLYEVEGELVFPKGVYNDHIGLPPEAKGDIPARDLTHAYRSRVILEFEKNLLRTEVKSGMLSLRSDSLGQILPQEEITVFDGQRVRVRDLVRDNPHDTDFRIYDGDQSLALTTGTGPFFLARGIVPPRFTVRQLRAPLDRMGFELREQTTLNGRTCWVVRYREPGRNSPDEYWVDTERDSSIVRWIKYNEDLVFARADMRYEQSAGEWLPTHIDQGEVCPPSMLYFAYRLKVTKAMVNPEIDHSEFLLAPRVGDAVIDFTDKTVYTMTETKAADYTVLVVWTVLGVAVVLAGVAIFWFRKRQRSQT